MSNAVTSMVLTLVAAPGLALQPRLIEEAGQLIASRGGQATGTDWLSPARAVDLFFQGSDTERIETELRQLWNEEPLDLAVQPVEGRKKKLLVSDMDSTIITVECIDELADFVGMKAKVAAITERAMNGELDFAQALAERVALLQGLPETALQQAYDERVKLMPGARALVRTMKANGAYCLLVSGGFTFFTSRVRDSAGFDADISNRLAIEKGRLTGQVLLPILGKEAKLAALQDAAKVRKISLAETLAIGDGANDLPMIEAAGFGAAYHAKPVVRAVAPHQVNHGDLTVLLYFQGYREADWIS